MLFGRQLLKIAVLRFFIRTATLGKPSLEELFSLLWNEEKWEAGRKGWEAATEGHQCSASLQKWLRLVRKNLKMEKTAPDIWDKEDEK